MERKIFSEAGHNSNGARLIEIHDTGDLIRCAIVDGILRPTTYCEERLNEKAKKYTRKKARTVCSVSGCFLEIE